MALAGAAKLYTFHTGAIQEAKQGVVTEYNAEYVRGLEQTLASTKKLHEDAVISEGKLKDEVKNIRGKYAALSDSVWNRPTREAHTEGSSTASCPASPNTGVSLSREDAEFLIGEAARAEQYLQERDFYYERYEAARKELKEVHVKD